MLIVPSKKLVYIDVPKTASSSIEQILQQVYGGRMFWTHPTLRKHCRDIPEDNKTWTKLVSARNPYERIISHYFFHIKRGVLNKIVPGCHPSEHTEDNLDRFLDHHVSLISKDSNTTDQEVYRLFPLWKYLEPIGWDVFVRVENLLEDLLDKDILQKPVLLPRVHNNPHISWANLKTPERREKIQEWAGIDFELFGYKR